MTFRPIPKDAPLREKLQAQLNYFRKEMDIPVPVKLLYGDSESISEQLFSDYHIRSEDPEYGERLGVSVFSFFSPKKPFVVVMEDWAKKSQHCLSSTHHEVAHIKDLRYSGEDNVLTMVKGDMELKMSKELGFKAAIEDGMIKGWPRFIIHDYYERILDQLADTRPTAEFVRKRKKMHCDIEAFNMARLTREWKTKQDTSEPMRDYMIRLLAMDLGKITTYGVSKRKIRLAGNQLKKHKDVIDGSADFFENMKRPTSIDIAKAGLKKLDKIVGLVGIGRKLN